MPTDRIKPGHRRILTELLALPTAPFVEHAIIDYVRAFCAARPKVRCESDRFGNLVIRLGRAATKPLVLAAHMDHPGFIAQAMIGVDRLRAEWFGGVNVEYFLDAKVRFFVDGRWVRGRIRSVEAEPVEGPLGKRQRVVSATIRVDRPVASSAVGMWDLDDPRIRGHRIHARACDDLAGVAAILACVDDLCERARPPALTALLTRTEEIGFVGATAAARDGALPKDALVVAIECSSERLDAKIGDGPILRIGDASSIFAPSATELCRHVADELSRNEAGFVYQRKLMDGGTCESTAYCAAGYAATGICVALGNYHNMNTRTGRIAAEYIDLRDWSSMVRWFVALADTYKQHVGQAAGRWKRLQGLAQPHLRRLQRRCHSEGTK